MIDTRRACRMIGHAACFMDWLHKLSASLPRVPVHRGTVCDWFGEDTLWRTK
jgi:hypothetical protein